MYLQIAFNFPGKYVDQMNGADASRNCGQVDPVQPTFGCRCGGDGAVRVQRTHSSRRDGRAE